MLEDPRSSWNRKTVTVAPNDLTLALFISFNVCSGVIFLFKTLLRLFFSSLGVLIAGKFILTYTPNRPTTSTTNDLHIKSALMSSDSSLQDLTNHLSRSFTGRGCLIRAEKPRTWLQRSWSEALTSTLRA